MQQVTCCLIMVTPTVNCYKKSWYYAFYLSKIVQQRAPAEIFVGGGGKPKKSSRKPPSPNEKNVAERPP